MHCTVMSAFGLRLDITEQGQGARGAFHVLYRIEPAPLADGPCVLVQSGIEPNWSQLPHGYLLSGPLKNPAVKSVDKSYQRLITGMCLRFRLLANPTRKIDTRSGPDGKRHHGRRVELRGDEACLAWLSRKADEYGFALTTVRVVPDVPNTIVRSRFKITGTRVNPSGRDTLTVGTALFEGELRITDIERFRRALVQGIGPAKSYGCGLLSIAPAH
jgi:CRISPR system Cascade subunit CasE